VEQDTATTAGIISSGKSILAVPRIPQSLKRKPTSVSARHGRPPTSQTITNDLINPAERDTDTDCRYPSTHPRTHPCNTQKRTLPPNHSLHTKIHAYATHSMMMMSIHTDSPPSASISHDIFVLCFEIYVLVFSFISE
jgi:hypothetical protein